MSSDAGVLALFEVSEEALRSSAATLSEEHSVPLLMVSLVRAGLPLRSFANMVKILNVREETLARLVHVSPRTFARRKKDKRLSSSESDHLFRVARTVVQAAEVLGGLEQARKWLRRPNRAFGNKQPLDLLDTDAGTALVWAALVRLDHGVFG